MILNLLSNARDAIDSRAEQMRKEMGSPQHFPKKLMLKIEVVSGTEVCLSVHDNGTGMSDEVKAKALQPFFTTKAVGRGTGLGLSISYGIIAMHNGRIEIDSTIGEGTTFNVYLPVFDEESEAAKQVTPKEIKA